MNIKLKRNNEQKKKQAKAEIKVEISFHKKKYFFLELYNNIRRTTISYNNKKNEKPKAES